MDGPVRHEEKLFGSLGKLSLTLTQGERPVSNEERCIPDSSVKVSSSRVS